MQTSEIVSIKEVPKINDQRTLAETLKARAVEPTPVAQAKAPAPIAQAEAPAPEAPAEAPAPIAQAEAPAPKTLVETIRERQVRPADFSKIKLPPELSKASPNYKTYNIDFGNDLYKALYIVRESRGDRSKSDAKYLDFVMKVTGFSEAEARQLGDIIVENIKAKENARDIKENTIKVDVNIFDKNLTPAPAPVARAEAPAPIAQAEAPMPMVSSQQSSNFRLPQ